MNRIVVVDDDSTIRNSLKIMFYGENIEIDEADNLEDGYKKISSGIYQLALLDVHFHQGATCLPVLERLKFEKCETPVIVLSGAASASEAVRAVQLGAYDFLEKPIPEQRLRILMERCLKEVHLKEVLNTVSRTDSRHESSFLGMSKPAEAIRRKIAKYADKNVPVLVTGETGTGKEVVAQSLREMSPRKNKIFVAVNAAAIPDALLESELFGHKRGAFTGAVSDSIGKIAAADGGTLFLDEIGDLSHSSQSKLLRFLETGEIQRIGSNQSTRVDVRIIAATSRDLQKEMKRNLFRSDLYYRLCVADIHIQPLRERPEDIELMLMTFIHRFAARHQTAAPVFSVDIFRKLQRYSWPGNVRELRNFAERVVIQCEGVVDEAALEELLPALGASNISGNVKSFQTEDFQLLPLKQFKNELEQKYILHVLESCGQNITQAAKILRIERAYLYAVMARLGIQRQTESSS
jgi:two-component system nitrogen regulation response regulator NtrX